MKTIVWVMTAVVLLASYAGAASLVGQWTFDGNGGTGALENKAPGISWSTITLLGDGAAVTDDGKLVLARYLYGQWRQSSAFTMLKTDLGPDGYFKEMTQVIWIKWPGFDTTAIWAGLAGMVKVTTEVYDPTNQTFTKAGQRIVMKATDNWNWGSHRVYEKSDNTAATQWAKNGGSDPPTDRYIKIAQVVRIYDSTKYAQAMYWDIGDGLAMIGTENTGLWNAYVMPFGQCGTPCIPYPANPGLRYDAFAFMDFSWAPIVQSAGEILFEEARVYAGAMTADEIAALQPAPFVPVPEPGALVALATGVLGLAGFARRRRG